MSATATRPHPPLVVAIGPRVFAWSEARKAQFWAHVSPEPNTGCWLWTATCWKNGYGKTCVDNKQVKAHRVSAALSGLDVDSGLHVLHRCDMPCCVNPAHLFLGTPGDNADDKVAKGRQSRGAGAGSAKLTEADVLQIRERRARGETNLALSRIFGVSEMQVGCISRGTKWAHVGGPRTSPGLANWLGKKRS